MPYTSTLTGLERNLAVAQARAEFDPKVVAAWLTGLRRQGLGLVLPALILKLDALTKADLDPRHRAAVLRLLKRPVLTAASSLPKPVVASSDYFETVGSGLTMEQRLLSAIRINCCQVLHGLSKREHRADPQCADARAWALRNVFDFIERELRYVIDWRVPWPPGIWQELHDLHEFLVVHAGGLAPEFAELEVAGQEQVDEQPLDPETAYKRVLLLGLAGQLKPTCGDDQVFLDHLGDWAANSRLLDPQTCIWQSNLVVVDMSKDSPPTWEAGTLAESFRGWVLEPARGFLAYLGRAPTLEGLKVCPLEPVRTESPLEPVPTEMPRQRAMGAVRAVGWR